MIKKKLKCIDDNNHNSYYYDSDDNNKNKNNLLEIENISKNIIGLSSLYKKKNSEVKNVAMKIDEKNESCEMFFLMPFMMILFLINSIAGMYLVEKDRYIKAMKEDSYIENVEKYLLDLKHFKNFSSTELKDYFNKMSTEKIVDFVGYIALNEDKVINIESLYKKINDFALVNYMENDIKEEIKNVKYINIFLLLICFGYCIKKIHYKRKIKPEMIELNKKLDILSLELNDISNKYNNLIGPYLDGKKSIKYKELLIKNFKTSNNLEKVVFENIIHENEKFDVEFYGCSQIVNNAKSYEFVDSEKLKSHLAINLNILNEK